MQELRLSSRERDDIRYELDARKLIRLQGQFHTHSSLTSLGYLFEGFEKEREAAKAKKEREDRMAEINENIQALQLKILKSDFWPKRNWWIIALTTLLISGIVSPVVSEYIKKTIWRETTQKKPYTPQATDTSRTSPASKAH